MSSSAFTPTTTQVTTEVPVNVPVVTAWQSYTPTFEGFGTPTAVSALWRRIGDSIEVSCNFTSGASTATIATISIPSGLNLDASKINGSGQSKILGIAMRATSVSTSFPTNTRGPFVVTESKIANTSKVYFSFTANTGSGGVFEVNTGASIISSGEQLTLEFRVPISQWSSGVTTLADRALEEYAFNTSTSTNTSDSTSFGYGPAGSQIQNITAGLTRRVRFQNAIQATDKFCLEVSINRVNWQDVSYRFGDNATSDIVQLTRQLSTTYGIGYIVPVNSTDIDITFGQYAEPSSATYGSAGRAWSVGAGSWYWRVRKVSSGAQVGYPISTKNIVGATDGVAPVTGMLGEVLTATLSNILISPTATAVTVGTLNLTPGTWQVFAKSMWSASSGASTATYYRVSISTILGSEHLPSANGIFNSSGVPDFYVSSCPRIITISQNQPIYMVSRADFTGTAQSTDASRSLFYAIRIA